MEKNLTRKIYAALSIQIFSRASLSLPRRCFDKNRAAALALQCARFFFLMRLQAMELFPAPVLATPWPLLGRCSVLPLPQRQPSPVPSNGARPFCSPALGAPSLLAASDQNSLRARISPPSASPPSARLSLPARVLPMAPSLFRPWSPAHRGTSFLPHPWRFPGSRPAQLRLLPPGVLPVPRAPWISLRVPCLLPPVACTGSRSAFAMDAGRSLMVSPLARPTPPQRPSDHDLVEAPSPREFFCWPSSPAFVPMAPSLGCSLRVAPARRCSSLWSCS
jgi:hypothetical protein